MLSVMEGMSHPATSSPTASEALKSDSEVKATVSTVVSRKRNRLRY